MAGRSSRTWGGKFGPARERRRWRLPRVRFGFLAVWIAAEVGLWRQLGETARAVLLLLSIALVLKWLNQRADPGEGGGDGKA